MVSNIPKTCKERPNFSASGFDQRVVPCPSRCVTDALEIVDMEPGGVPAPAPKLRGRWSLRSCS